MLRSKRCSQREMERNKVASRETSKAVFEAADRLGIYWPIDDDITNADLERMLFPDKYKSVCLYVEPDYPYIPPRTGQARRYADASLGRILPLSYAERRSEHCADMVRDRVL